MDLFTKRRSVRAYTNQPVSEAVLLELIEAARVAPSGNHTQPWKFIAIRSEQQRKKIMEVAHNQTWMMSAPLFIVCVADASVRFKEDSEDIVLNETTGYKEQKLVLRDTAIAVEHIVLKAVELGLGTCWVGYFTQQEIRDVLEIPNNKHVVAILTIGYPNPEVQPKEKVRKSVSEILMQEQWQKN